MSKGDSDADGGGAVPAPVEKVVRTVTPPFHGRPDAEMTLIGLAYFLGIAILLVPLLPFIVLVWLLSKVTGAVAQKAPTERLPGGGSSR